MNFGICHLSLAPIREENSHRSEMVSQLLYGDCFEILKKKKEWLYIRCLFDDYCGWIDEKQSKPISEEMAFQITIENPKYAMDIIHYVQIGAHEMMPILLGSNIAASDYLKHRYDGATHTEKQPKVSIVDTASLYLNAPYLWGGKSPFGVDCSGFTQMIYRVNGYRLPRDAYQQAKEGATLSFIEESKPGDLAFFDNAEGKITHVGVLLENNYIMHAHGCVRIDRIDQSGIYNSERKSHSHPLRLIKKII